MAHPLADYYDLTAEELLDAVNERFRLKVALEGAVAEVQFEKKLRDLKQAGSIHDYESHDRDGYPDFSIWPSAGGPELLVEIKNIRDAKDGYRRKGEYYAYKVEVQKTRASTSDASSRSYDVDHFDILGVCLGKKTGDWTDFFFIRASDLTRHSKYQDKLAANHKVPLLNEASEPRLFGSNFGSWYRDLKDLLTTFRGPNDA